jgi:hypothetical protein
MSHSDSVERFKVVAANNAQNLQQILNKAEHRGYLIVQAFANPSSQEHQLVAILALRQM